MTKKKQNGEAVETPGDTTYADVVTGKKRPQPRMVLDPFTNEYRAENKQERFRRLAEQRVTVACRRISLVCSLGNKSQYDYTDENVTKIMTELQEAVNNVRSAFSGRKPAVQGFKL